MINKVIKDKVSVSIIVFGLTFPFFALFLSSFFTPVHVSASTGVSWLEPPLGFEAGNDVTDNQIDSVINAFKTLYDNCGFGYKDYYVCVNHLSVSNVDGGIVVTGIMMPSGGYNYEIQQKSINDTVYDIYTCDQMWRFSINLNTLVSMSEVNFGSNSTYYKYGIFYNSNLGYTEGQIRNYGTGSIQNTGLPPTSTFIYFNNVGKPFDPVLDPILDTPYNLKIQSEGFVEWLINTGKYLDIKSELLENHVGGWVKIFAEYGSSPKWFRDVAIQFANANRISMGIEDANLALSKTKALYQEYLTLKNDTYRNHLKRRTWNTDNVIPVSNDTNNTLITDDSSDTLDISILRDILRGVINISNVINDNLSILFDYLDNLDNTVNIVNDGGLGFDSVDIWGSGSITECENYLALTAAFMDKGVDVSAAENMEINYLENASQADSFTVSVVMPDQFVNGQFTEKTVTHTIDSTSKMYNTLILFRKLIAFAVVAYFAIRIRFELPHLIRGE